MTSTLYTQSCTATASHPLTGKPPISWGFFSIHHDFQFLPIHFLPFSPNYPFRVALSHQCQIVENPLGWPPQSSMSNCGNTPLGWHPSHQCQIVETKPQNKRDPLMVAPSALLPQHITPYLILCFMYSSITYLHSAVSNLNFA